MRQKKRQNTLENPPGKTESGKHQSMNNQDKKN